MNYCPCSRGNIWYNNWIWTNMVWIHWAVINIDPILYHALTNPFTFWGISKGSKVLGVVSKMSKHSAAIVCIASSHLKIICWSIEKLILLSKNPQWNIYLILTNTSHVSILIGIWCDNCHLVQTNQTCTQNGLHFTLNNNHLWCILGSFRASGHAILV